MPREEKKQQSVSPLGEDWGLGWPLSPASSPALQFSTLALPAFFRCGLFPKKFLNALLAVMDGCVLEGEFLSLLRPEIG
jgi:hypothetical protein